MAISVPASSPRRSAAPAPALATEGLERRFGATVAVRSLDLRVERGTTLGLLGHNGAGKTTTVRLLNGVLEPTAGRATVLGLDPWRDGVELRRRTGVSTETPAVDDRLSGRAGLTFFAELYGVPRRDVDRRVDELLDAFDLVGAADALVGSYSRGMKQRLALARALIHEPELLFLDEPTAGLDPVAARATDERIMALRAAGTTVVLCTHNLAQAQHVCDRVVVLERGAVVADGTPTELARALAGGVRASIEVGSGDGAPVPPLGPTLAAAGVAVVEERRAPDGRAVRVVIAPSGVASADGAPAGVTPAAVAAAAESSADGAAAVADAVAALVHAGLRVYAVQPQERDLEDVYFALHERQVRAS